MIFYGTTAPSGSGPPHRVRLTITFRYIRTSSAGLLWTSNQADSETATYTTRNKHMRHTSMHPAGFEPAMPAIKLPQTHVLHRAATGIGTV